MLIVFIALYILGAIATALSLGLIQACENWGDVVFATLVTLFWPAVWAVLIPLIIDAHMASKRKFGV